MTQVTTTRRTLVISAQAIAGMLVFGLVAAGLVATAIMLRPSAGAPVSIKAPVVQAPTRDDFAFRQVAAATSKDDYGLRHNTAPAIAATSRSDDYGVRHPSAAASGSLEQRSTDFALRHATWQLSSQPAVGPDDYGLR